MSDLEDFQFELLQSPADSDGFVFGFGTEMSTDENGFHPGDDEWDVQDAPNSVRGGMLFGRDVLQGPTWGWDLFVNREDTKSALDTLSRFKTAWRAMKVRQTPGAQCVIRYKLDGRVRRIYGRPRRYSAPPNNLILSGYIPVTVDFQAADSMTYDDVESELTLQIQHGSDGGITFPTTFPTTTTPVGTKGAVVGVEGDEDVHPVVRFTGPVTNPRIETDLWELGLDISIPAGHFVEVDTRPSARSALMDGWQPVALNRFTKFADIKFPVGRTRVTYWGSADVYSSTCTIRWANAYNSI